MIDQSQIHDTRPENLHFETKKLVVCFQVFHRFSFPVNQPFVFGGVLFLKITTSCFFLRYLDDQLSNEKKLGCLEYLVDYNAELCLDCNKPLKGSL